MGIEENKNIKIPTKHYVGFQKRSGDEIPLGFMTPHGEDAAFEKRKASVDRWVGGYGYSSAKQAELPAKVLDNKPMSGFKMGNSVTHGGDWNSVSTKWRVEDPRGFALEITPGNLEEIMRVCTIEKLEVLNQCIWARMGSNNILVPVEHPLYIAATENTTRDNQRVSTKDLTPGATIVMKNGSEGIYLGRIYAFGYAYRDKDSYDRTFKTRVMENINPKPLHAFISVDEKTRKMGMINFKNSLTVAQIFEPAEPKTVADMVDIANNHLNESNASIDLPNAFSHYRSLMVTEKPLDAKDFDQTIELMEIATSAAEAEAYLSSKGKIYRNYLLIKHDTTGEVGYAHFNTYRYPGHAFSPFALKGNVQLVDQEMLAQNEIKLLSFEQSFTQWNGRPDTRTSPLYGDWSSSTHDDFTFYYLVVKFKTPTGIEMFHDLTQFVR